MAEVTDLATLLPIPMSTSNPNDPKPHELSEGFRLGPYTIMHKIGSGGMADVYFGMHDELHRPAAIKVLRPSLAADEANLQRFLQEARAAASLVHPNIVQVYDVGQQESATATAIRCVTSRKNTWPEPTCVSISNKMAS